jgi:hypothetical protein
MLVIHDRAGLVVRRSEQSMRRVSGLALEPEQTPVGGNDQ